MIMSSLEKKPGAFIAMLLRLSKMFMGKCLTCGQKKYRKMAWVWGLSVGLICFALWIGDVYRDSDEDGLTDADEVNIYGTNPALADPDGDGFP